MDSDLESDHTPREKEARVLLIDDDSMARHTVAMMLEQLGYHVLQADSGESGLIAFREELPHLVVTDLIMPKKEGIEIICEIKSEKPDTRIVAISGGGRLHAFDLLTMAQHLGADAMLRKPFGVRELADAVTQAITTTVSEASRE